MVLKFSSMYPQGKVMMFSVCSTQYTPDTLWQPLRGHRRAKFGIVIIMKCEIIGCVVYGR